jgi:tight adherence protein B
MTTVMLMLLFAFLGLSGLGFTAFLVVTGQSRQDRLKQRFQTATEPHMRMRRIEAPRVIRSKEPERTNSPLDRAARIFGFAADRPEQYPVKWWMVLLVVAVVARLISSLVIGLIGQAGWVTLPAIWILGSRTVFNMMVNRRRQKLYTQFPDCLSMIVRSVRAGVPLTEAIRIVAKESPLPSSDEFNRVAGDLAIGTPISDALKSMADRNDITEFRFFATALTLQSQTGGRLGETLDNLGGIVRKRMALKSRGRALASEARTTALILGCLPVLAAGALYLLNPGYVGILFTDKSGQMILAVAVTMLGIGAFIMRAIIEKALA